jgi:hypothetical protein
MVAQITQTQRIERIQDLLRELNKVPPERHEVARLPWSSGEPLLCPVIKIRVDEVLLNHRSHRLRSQLEDDPEWRELASAPDSEPAQRVLERLVRRARTEEQFAALKESLQRDGQTDAGVMTHDGVLVNANTRAVAIREFEDPARRYIRVAVLPPTAQPDEKARGRRTALRRLATSNALDQAQQACRSMPERSTAHSAVHGQANDAPERRAASSPCTDEAQSLGRARLKPTDRECRSSASASHGTSAPSGRRRGGRLPAASRRRYRCRVVCGASCD